MVRFSHNKFAVTLDLGTKARPYAYVIEWWRGPKPWNVGNYRTKGGAWYYSLGRLTIGRRHSGAPKNNS